MTDCLRLVFGFVFCVCIFCKVYDKQSKGLSHEKIDDCVVSGKCFMHMSKIGRGLKCSKRTRRVPYT